MGASAGGVSIKTNTSCYPLHQIVKDLIGLDFIQTNNYQDTRDKDKYYITKTKDIITIYNSDFVERFFRNQDDLEIQNFIKYFKTPELVFAHERYDSGGTYSYSLIYNGIITRQFRSVSYETTIDFGTLEEVEKNWKDSETEKFDLGDGTFEILIRNSKTGFECEIDNLPQAILNQLQFEKLGFDFEDDEDKIIEQAFFVKQEKDTDILKDCTTIQTEDEILNNLLLLGKLYEHQTEKANSHSVQLINMINNITIDILNNKEIQVCYNFYDQKIREILSKDSIYSFIDELLRREKANKINLNSGISISILDFKEQFEQNLIEIKTEKKYNPYLKHLKLTSERFYIEYYDNIIILKDKEEKLLINILKLENALQQCV